MHFVSTIVAIALALLTSTASADDAQSSSSAIEIRVEAGGWSNVRPRDIETVLASVAATLASSLPSRGRERISVAYSPAGPSVLLERSPDGARRVFLKVEGARWDQFAYQFSHELCHIFTNHEHREIAPGALTRDHQWFEETLCEAVSLFTLERMAASWAKAPPYPSWRSYASAFGEYAEELLKAPHRRLPPNVTLSEWMATNRPILEADPYARQQNELLAVYLFSLLQAEPEALPAIGYLNAEKGAVPQSFSGYLETWFDCCPAAHRKFIANVMNLLRESGQQPTEQTTETKRSA